MPVADIFDSIPVITVIMFAMGLVGAMIYEKSRFKGKEKSSSQSA